MKSRCGRKSGIRGTRLLDHPLVLIIKRLSSGMSPTSAVRIIGTLVGTGGSFRLIIVPKTRRAVKRSFNRRGQCSFFIHRLVRIGPPG